MDTMRGASSLVSTVSAALLAVDSIDAFKVEL